MKRKEFKIKGEYSIDYPRNINLYRVSKSGVLTISDTVKINLGEITFDVDEVLSVDQYKPTQISFEPWLKIDFITKGREQTIYFCSDKFLGLDNLISKSRLKKIERILKERITST